MAQYIHVLFGAPGTGKTEALSDILVNVELARGVKLDQCLVASFTVDASEEIINRIFFKLGITDPGEQEKLKDEMFMGTIHSLCFWFLRELGISPDKVMTGKDFITWAERNNLEHIFSIGRSNIISQQTILKYGMIEPQDTQAGVVLQAIEWVNHTFYNDVLTRPFSEYSKLIFNAPILYESSVKLNYDLLPQYWDDYEKYKKEHGKIDYADMLLIAYAKDFIPPTRVMFIDEFQDLSPLKYALYRKWTEKHERVYISGDDEQAIFRFIGSSYRFLLQERNRANRVVSLPKSFRLPLTILSVTRRFARQNIIPAHREEKWVEPRARGGIFRLIQTNDIVDFVSKNLVGSGFILVRTNFQLREITRQLVNHPRLAVPYTYIRPDAQSVYNLSFCNFINALLKYEEEQSLTHDEWYAIVIRLHKGIVKENIVSKLINEPQPSYSFDDILSMLVRPMLIDDLIMNLNISDLEISVASKHMVLKQPIPLPVPLQIGTIHSAKGLQADTVFIINNITRRIRRSIVANIENYEDEARVWYVGMTRAKERLFVIDDYFRTGNVFKIQ